jgi:hypothetical protein
MSFDVELEALRSDARTWDKARQELAGPTNAIKPLILDITDLTPVGDYQKLNETYEKARGNMERLLGEAAGYFDRMEDGLIAVAKEYEQLDQASGGRFRQGQNALDGNR